MRRIAVTFMLLTGLSGCISVTGQPLPSDRKISEFKGSTPTSTANVIAGNPTGPLPAPSSYDPHPDHYRYGSYSSYSSNRTQNWNAAPTAVAAQSLPAQPVPAQTMPGTTTPAPVSSLTPMVTTPPKSPAAAAAPAAAASASSTTPTPADSAVVQANFQTPATASESSGVQQASFSTPAEPKSTTKVDPPAVKTPPTTPPMPSVKGGSVGEVKTARAGAAPLMRMVNSKRITLDFEVKDVGPSGLSSVELWYTRDCHEWKKYNAPPHAKAYVVEVDEEGMYGFTLLARSGLGLSKEPPGPGDQPQVWVIVDLTKPDMQLGEFTPTANYNNKVQQLTIKWKASDKNLDRQPITLFYADKEDGPWKTIASGLSNTGVYNWQVPPDAPARFLVRAEAVDLAGNIGRAQSSKPVLLDTRVPSVTILNVEANNSH